MRTIKATDDLVIELWPAGTAWDEPVLKIKSLSGERDEVQQVVIVFLDEVSHLIVALTEAAELLAAEAKGIQPVTSKDILKQPRGEVWLRNPLFPCESRRRPQ